MASPDFDRYAPLISSKPAICDLYAFVHDFLNDHSQVRFVRLQWQDHSGILRTRMVATDLVLSLTRARRLIHTPPIAFHCIVDNSLVPDLDPTGNHWLVPDWSSLRILPSCPRYAVVMCGVLATTPAKPIPSYNLCPRAALAHVVRRAAEMHHLIIQVGFEVEFEIMQRPPPAEESTTERYLVPASCGLGRYAVAGLRDPRFAYIEEVMERLLDSGVNIQAVQTEGRRGQYEFSLGPRPPLEAVDELLMVHDTLKMMLGQHGYVATMAPKPVESRRQATGQHTHISISSTENEEAFLAGIIGRLRALCAVCLPYGLSYERVQPYLGGNVVAWGTENREVPIRKIKAGHWEVRCVDATTNMYLVLAAVIGSGLLGIEQREPLHWPDTAYNTDKNRTPNSKLVNGTHANGIKATNTHTEPDRLPRCLDEALSDLERQCPEMERIMDSTVLQHYLSLKRVEASRLAALGPQSVRDLLSELF